jgi:acyl-CoA synthetase (AMP-forming)/AMP-acid ligase II
VRVNGLLEARAADMPHKTALVCGMERYTYAQVDEEARRFARLLYEAAFALATAWQSVSRTRARPSSRSSAR